MVSVDDLVISLRIDETSNLGKLQKQLTTLVGPKGERRLDFGGMGGGILKTDLNYIKNKLMELSPTVLSTDIKDLKESARVSLRQLSKRAFQEQLMTKYGISMSKIEMWQQFLIEALKKDGLGTGKLANFIERMADMFKGAARLGGPEKTRVTAVDKALTEGFIQDQIEKTLERAEKVVRGQRQYYEIYPKRVKQNEKMIDKVIGEKVKEIGSRINYTEEIGNKIIELSKKSLGSDEFVEKVIKDILKIGTDSTTLLDKLIMGTADPILELIALLRIKSAKDQRGMVLAENLKHYIEDVLPTKKSLYESHRALDVRMDKVDLQKIADYAEKKGLRVTGPLKEILERSGDKVHVELKKIFTKGVADIDIRADKRFKEVGVKEIVYFALESKKQGRRAMKRWGEESKEFGLGALTAVIEINTRELEEIFGQMQNIMEQLEKNDVEYDKSAVGIGDLKEEIRRIIMEAQAQGKTPEEFRRIINELYGITEVIDDIAEGQEDFLRKDFNDLPQVKE